MTRENELFKRIKSGDKTAFNELVGLYYTDILRYCSWHTPNKESAEDATQETFFKAIRYLEQYAHKGQFKAFLYKIAKHTCMDMQSRKFMKDVSLESQQQDFSYTEEGFKEIEADMALCQMTDSLPEELRELVILRYGQELTLREIANITELPLRTVQSRIRQALKQLKSGYAKGGNR